MDRAEAESTARQGYDRMAQIYADHVALEMTVPGLVRSVIESFAQQVLDEGGGAVADIGCGPGHVTAHLAAFGLDIFGIDNSPALLDIARKEHPQLRFEIGQLASLPVDSGALRAVMSKHSLIHTPAALVPSVLDEFARVLAPGGLLFVSFFGASDPSTHGESFDHAVSTAYQIEVDTMADLLRSAGFTEDLRIIRQPKENERQLPHGTLIARRSSIS